MPSSHGSRAFEADTLAAARKVACQVVAEHWPDLVGVEPTVTPRTRKAPSHDVLNRAGVAPGEIVFTPEANSDEYIFTFATETRTPDGHMLPRIARVTVDAHQRVVKTTASK